MFSPRDINFMTRDHDYLAACFTLPDRDCLVVVALMRRIAAMP
jgi:hypothetical protein